MQILSRPKPSLSSTCDSVDHNRFSTSALCHARLRPITLCALGKILDTSGKSAAFLHHRTIRQTHTWPRNGGDRRKCQTNTASPAKPGGLGIPVQLGASELGGDGLLPHTADIVDKSLPSKHE